MMKLKTTILFGAIAAVMLITPVFANAQINVDNVITIQEVNYVNNTASRLFSVEDIEIAHTACKLSGDELHTITKGKYSTFWTATQDCVAGAVDKSTPVDANNVLKRDYNVVPDDWARNFYDGIGRGNVTDSNGAYALDADKYNEILSQKKTDPSVTFFDRMVNFILVSLVNIIAVVMAGIATFMLGILNTVIEFTQGVPPAIVSQGWGIIRDLSNLVFILALIAMALATITQKWESYNYKNVLGRLILMALLINFSKVMADAVIAVSDNLILMLRPQGGFKEYGTVIYQGFVFGGDFSTGNFIGWNMTAADGVGSSIMKLVGLTVLTISLAAFAGLMFVRMIGLWFLVMVSPAAVALNVLPGTQKYTNQWLGLFQKYLIWGPLAMFWFRLSFIFLGQTGNNFTGSLTLNYIVISAFLWAGFLVTKSTGMMGSDLVTNYTNKAMDKARNFGKGVATGTGSMMWRGTIPAAAGGAGKYLLTRGTHAERKEAAGKTFNNVQEAIGSRTARVQNIPGNFKQKWITNPDEKRKKLVDRERRRTQIRRNYFKLDDETAKKFSPEDTAYLIQEDKWDEGNMRSILRNGSPEAKLTVMRAFREGHIKVKTGKFEQAQYDQLYSEARKVALKAAGVKESDAEYNTYMAKPEGLDLSTTNPPENDVAGIDRILTIRRKPKYNPDGDFASRVKESYIDTNNPNAGRRRAGAGTQARNRQTPGAATPTPTPAPAATGTTTPPTGTP